MNIVPHEISCNKLTIVSPHQDDAALSLANYIMGYATGNIRIINCFTISDYCPYGGASERCDVMALRCKEDRSFAVHKHNSAIEIIDLDEYDSLIRLNTTNMNDLFITHELGETAIEHMFSLRRKLVPYLGGTLLLPMAIEGHIDHVLSCLAAISLLKHYDSVAFYLDVPYWIRTSMDLIKQRISHIESLIGLTLKPHASLISPAWNKQQLSDIYRSQVTRHEILNILNAPFQGEVLFLPDTIGCKDMLVEEIRWTDLNH